MASRCNGRATALLAGDIPDGSTITLDAAADELVVRWTGPRAETREQVAA